MAKKRKIRKNRKITEKDLTQMAILKKTRGHGFRPGTAFKDKSKYDRKQESRNQRKELQDA